MRSAQSHKPKLLHISAAGPAGLAATNTTKVTGQGMCRHGYATPILFGSAACDTSGSSNRWYSDQQIESGGRILFAQHCAEYHGEQAQGRVTDWQRSRPNGLYPPPPLNDAAHAWHHSPPLLAEIIQKGDSLYDGKISGFQGRLKESEQLATIAWFQSLWSNGTYRLWGQGNQPQQSSGKFILTSENGEK